jgi:hypothetical protein
VQLSARHAFGDLRSLQFGDRAKHREGELVFGVVDVILALDDDLLAVLEKLADDDRLICDVAGDAIRVEEIDRLEGGGL